MKNTFNNCILLVSDDVGTNFYFILITRLLIIFREHFLEQRKLTIFLYLKHYPKFTGNFVVYF